MGNCAGDVAHKSQTIESEEKMELGVLGKVYQAGEVIVHQGEVGECMYVIQAGQVEVLQKQAGQETSLAVLGPGDFFSEMGLFDKDVRSATVRALGEARVLTVDKRTLHRRLNEDPSLAYRIIQTLSQRVRKLNAELARSKP
jgi:CRP-like cAMP-binding protein